MSAALLIGSSLLLTSATPVHADATFYNISVLDPHTNGYRSSYPRFISSDGSVLSGETTNSDGVSNWTEAFRWTESGGMQGLGVLGTDPSGYRYSYAYAMSYDGSVLAGDSSNSDGVNDWREAFRWTESGGMQGLGVLAVHTNGNRDSDAYAMSSDGSVLAGGSANSDGVSNWTEAFRWTESGGMQGLGVLGTNTYGDHHSQATAMSSDGSVIAGFSTNYRDGISDLTEAFRWTETGGMQGLGVLAPAFYGVSYSYAQLVSSDGSVIAGRSSISDGEEAFRWTESGGMQGLGVLGNHQNGYRYSGVSFMSSDGGVIVGQTTNSDGINHWNEVFRWTESGGMQGLGVLAAQTNGYRDSNAYAMSSNGSVLAGESTNSDGVSDWREAFRWTESGGMQGLGVLAAHTNGDRDSDARVMSSDGRVIAGRSSNSDGINNWDEAFRWTETGGMQSVADWLGPSIHLTGLRIYSVDRMNADGTILAGQLFDLWTGHYTAYWARTGCLLSVGDNTCLISSTTNQATPLDALAGIDTLQLGGPTNFTFNVAGIGAIYTNFETFQKIDASNVTLTGAASVGANWDIVGGTLTASTGNNIFNTSAVNVGGVGSFAVASSEAIGRLTGSGATTLSAGQTLTVGDATSFAYTGTTSGAGSLTKVGTGRMSTGNLGHTGLTTVAAGTLAVNGTIADSVVVNGGATLSGNASIAGNLTLNPGATLAPGNSPGTTVVGGNFVGGGTLVTEVQFNNAGAPVNGTTHDFLNIAGNASGTTLLNVVAFAPSNAPAETIGNGIELLRVGSTTGASTFQLAAPIIFGAVEYALNYLPNYSGVLDGYFLQSRASESMHGEAAMLAAGQAMIAGCLTGEDALVGDGNSHRGRAWAKAGRGNRDTGGDTGLTAGSDYECAAGGVDIAAAGHLRFGLSGGYGVSDGNVLTPAGAGRLEGDGGIVQLYAEFHSGDFFANVTGGWGVFDWTFDGPNTGVASAQLDGTVGALQLGHYWPIDWFRLGAIGEIAYNGMDCGSDCFLAGTASNANEWFYEGTVRADTVLSDGEVRPYLALSLAHGGANTVTNGIASVTTDTNALRFVGKGGASFMVDTQTALFVNGGMTEGLDNDIEGWDVGVGMKTLW